MCGRYAAAASVSDIVETFDISFVDEDAAETCEPRYNIAPTDTVAAVVERAAHDEVTRKLVPVRWGLVPSWAKAPGAPLINARVETVTTKPAFRKAASARRCLLPALGYYEWRQEIDGGLPVKQPYFFAPERGLLAMAGLYEFWRGPDGWLASATIITTDATDDVGWVHDRMPMSVPMDAWDDWLDPQLTDAAAAVSLLRAPVDLAQRRVSRAVNKVGVDGAQLIEAVSA